MGARCVGLWLLCYGVDVVSMLLGLGRRLYGAMFLPFALVPMLLFVVGVHGVLSFCFEGLRGHLDPLRVVLFLGIFVISEFFVTADVISLFLIR